MTLSACSPLLELRDITKRYGELVANDAINLTVHAGETHAILGENGAGKSTLMKIIFGVHQPDQGEILWQGKPIPITNPAKARDLGISMVFQHFSLFETISVVENISLTIPAPLPNLAKRILAKSKAFGLPVNPQASVHSLSVGERQRVEIIRCLLQEPKLMILDEPTSVLPPPAVDRLFTTLRNLSAHGIAILYISHKLEEIRALCDRATVLRGGVVTGTANPTKTSAKDLATLMIGRNIPQVTHRKSRTDGTPQLTLKRLNYHDPNLNIMGLKDISLTVQTGEIVGVAGVSGNGQLTLARLISGEDVLSRNQANSIRMQGEPVGHLPPDARRKRGLSFVPEDRLGRGTVPSMSISNNGLLTGHRLGIVKRGMIRRHKRDTFAQDCIKAMNVQTPNEQAKVASLSGGNLQKFIIAREMALKPQLLVVSQPTWGIDVGAAALVRQRLIDLRDNGTAILIISEELEELFEISDRLTVMYNGQLSIPMFTRDTTFEQIGQMMMGQLPTFMETAE
ncbi:MAG: ABC transporter ATP-binding protein [Aestuariivita sp.]|nr:ABC transporter ATP-binding protein [Aestuariivita sp.]